MRDQVDEEAENTNTVDVSRKLEEGELESGKDRKKTVNARNLVEDQCQGNQLSASLQANEAEEGLIATVSTMISSSSSLEPSPDGHLLSKRGREGERGFHV